jgi:hypothetical protein
MVSKHLSINIAGRLLCILLLMVCSQCRSLPGAPDAPAPLADPAPLFNQLFSQKNGGWTGGDGTLSIRLPGSRTAWLFGDTFLGHIEADGTRSKATPFIRNCLVIQNGNSLETRHRGSHGEPSAFFAPPSPKEWYWPGDGTVVGNRAKVFLHRFEEVSQRLWGWTWTGTALATLSLPELEVERIDDTVAENGIMYGVSILETDPYTYIYGTSAVGHPKLAHIARAPRGLSGPWTYYSDQGWSDDSMASMPIVSGISTQYAVFSIGNIFYLITMDSRSPFPDAIAAYRAINPWGPWQGPRIIYRVPDVDANIVAYNPFVHTQFAEGSRQLISYNLNHVNDPTALYQDASIYRPRFIRVDFEQVEKQFH